MDTLFVYGTLRPPQADTTPADSRYYPTIASYIRSHQPATLHAAALYSLGTYPAAIPGQGNIEGDLLYVDEGALPIADRIEGHPHFFRRTRVTVQIAEQRAEAWVYWASTELTLGKPRILSGNWFRRTQELDDMSHANLADEESAVDSVNVDPILRTLVQRFAESPCSWLSTVRPDSRAHSSPIWHVWHRGRAYIVTRPTAIKTVNVAENPSVVITHPDPLSPIIIEGWATEANGLRTRLQPLFHAKYSWDISSDAAYATILEITPTKLMAWGEHGEGRWSGIDVMQVWL